MTPDSTRVWAVIEKHRDLGESVKAAYAKFQADTGLSPEELTDSDAMIFQIAYAAGMLAGVQKAMKAAGRDPEQLDHPQ